MAQDPKQQPQALEAEMAVLGSMLIEREATEKALDLVAESDFFLPAHRVIFHAIAELFRAKLGVDLVTVSEELKKKGRYDEVGGAQALVDLVHKVTTAAHVEHYARVVKDRATLRELITAATEIIRSCYEADKPTIELVDVAQSVMLKLSDRQTNVGIEHVKNILHEVLEQMERAHKDKQDVTGIPSGIRALDRMTSGFQKSDLILLAARPSQGKTALAINIISHIVLQKNIPVAFFSLEMNKHAIMQRFISGESGISLKEIRNGFFKRDRWTDLTTTTARFSEAPLYVDDKSGLTVMSVRASCRQLQSALRKEGKALGVVVIDYLQLLRGSASRNDGRQQEVSEISRSLKQLAKELNVPVIALSQLSRASEDKARLDNRPKLSDLRESGSLEQDADLVMMIHRESYYKRNDPTLEKKAEIIIAKQRQGPTGNVDVAFLPECTKFADESGVDESTFEESQATFS